MKAILVDDERLALDVLEKILNKFKEVEVVGSFTNPQKALEEIRKNHIDTIFLDIEMGNCNGIEMAQIYMNEKPSLDIIFVTAYSQYAVEAFEVNALDYLLKPVQEKRIRKTMARLEEKRIEKEGKEREREREEKNKNQVSHLKIKSFGKFEVMDGEGQVLGWRTQKSKELFAFLWINGERPVSKYVIMETIFPDRDPEKAATILHTTIYQLRKGLEKVGFPKGIIYKNEAYQLNLPIKSDKEEIMKIIKKDRLEKKDTRKISDSYKGDFLEEESYPWVMDRQYNYKESIFNKLENYVERGLEADKPSEDLKVAIDTLLRIDPFRECAARHMIYYYGENDMKANLKTFYEEYRDKLWREMKLRPMVETIDLYRQYIYKK